MNETTAPRPAVQWFCPWHGYVDSLPCPFCPQRAQTTATTAGVKLITEAELEARLEAHLRSVERRWSEQRTELVKILLEGTRELRDQIGGLLDRIADQDAEIVRLRAEVKTQRRLSIANHSFLATLDDGFSRIEARLADLEQRRQVREQSMQ